EWTSDRWSGVADLARRSDVGAFRWAIQVVEADRRMPGELVPQRFINRITTHQHCLQRRFQLNFQQRLQLWWGAIDYVQSVRFGVPNKLTCIQTHFIGNELQRVTVEHLQPLFD